MEILHNPITKEGASLSIEEIDNHVDRIQTDYVEWWRCVSRPQQQ